MGGAYGATPLPTWLRLSSVRPDQAEHVATQAISALAPLAARHRTARRKCCRCTARCTSFSRRLGSLSSRPAPRSPQPRPPHGRSWSGCAPRAAEQVTAAVAAAEEYRREVETDRDRVLAERDRAVRAEIEQTRAEITRAADERVTAAQQEKPPRPPPPRTRAEANHAAAERRAAAEQPRAELAQVRREAAEAGRTAPGGPPATRRGPCPIPHHPHSRHRDGRHERTPGPPGQARRVDPQHTMVQRWFPDLQQEQALMRLAGPAAGRWSAADEGTFDRIGDDHSDKPGPARELCRGTQAGEFRRALLTRPDGLSARSRDVLTGPWLVSLIYLFAWRKPRSLPGNDPVPTGVDFISHPLRPAPQVSAGRWRGS